MTGVNLKLSFVSICYLYNISCFHKNCLPLTTLSVIIFSQWHTCTPVVKPKFEGHRKNSIDFSGTYPSDNQWLSSKGTSLGAANLTGIYPPLTPGLQKKFDGPKSPNDLIIAWLDILNDWEYMYVGENSMIYLVFWVNLCPSQQS